METLANHDKTDDALRVGDQLLAPSAFLRWKADATAEGGWKKSLAAAIDPLLDRFGWNGAEPAQRAAVHYAKGVVLSRAGRRAECESAFESARSLAGPGDLRLDAIYNLGASQLMEGEAQRAQIPELGGKPSAAPSAPSASGASNAPGPGAASGAPPPDPLELARAAYLRARDHFSERLQSDWRDADTRANVELVARRLKELSDIQKKRDEQKKQQEQQQKQDSKDKDKQSKDDKSKDAQKKDQEKQDSKDKADQDKQQQDEKKNDGQDQKKPDEKKPDEKPQDQKNAENDKDKSAQDAQTGDEKEQKLTKEQMIQLFDRLNQIEEKAKQMQAQIRRARAAKVKRDW
jgi:hypothetical protein